jgi:hypothetical protein
VELAAAAAAAAAVTRQHVLPGLQTGTDTTCGIQQYIDM